MEIDNRWIADYKKGTEIIKSEMKDKLPQFDLLEENLLEETYYYYLVYKYNDMDIKIGGDQGYIMLNLKINNVTANLYRENKRINELEAASENNFQIAIRLLKAYLEKNKLI